MRTTRLFPILPLLFLAHATYAPAIQAQTIKHPGDHPQYPVEIEPHALYAWNHGYYAGDGFGLGGRFSIPIVQNGFIPSINNSVAIGLGLDWLHYGACYYDYRGYCYGNGVDYIHLPVVMQWNFFVAERWSVFGEPGLYIYHGFFNSNYPCNGPGLPPCGFYYYPNPTGVDFAFWAGGRFHFNEHVALTMRIGYPTLSIGVSFMP